MKPWKAIAAMSQNRVIGNKGEIPWHLPEDFKWFKRTTLGGTLIMGRVTWESIGKPLPGRKTVVLSRSKIDLPPEVSLYHSLEAVPAQENNIWICGGAKLYRQALPACTDLYLSIIEKKVQGDAFFPEFEEQFTLCGEVFRSEGFHVLHYKNLNKDHR